MRKCARPRLKGDGFVQNFARCAVGAGVDEDDPMGAADRLDQFGRQLVFGLYLHKAAAQALTERLGDLLPNRIITAQGITVANDQDYRLISETTSPPGATS